MRTCAAISLAAILLAACAATPAAPAEPLTRRFADPVTIDPAHPPALEEINFQSGGARLNGLVYLANGPGPHPAVLLLHGYPGNEKNLDLAQALRRDGFNVMFFHYRGAWGSEGTFSFSNVIADVSAAADFLQANAATYRTDPGRIIPIGHSMGGFAAIAAAADDARFTCAAGLDPADFGALAAGIAANPGLADTFAAYTDMLQMLNGFSGDAALAELFANTGAFDLRGRTGDLAGKSVLIVGAQDNDPLSRDQMVRPLMEIYDAAPDIDATTVMLPGDHSFSWSREALINTVADWAQGCR